MKKILICTPNLSGGGAEKVLINILNNLDYKRYNVTLLLLWKYGTYIEDVPSNVKIKYIWPNNKNINQNIRHLKLFPRKYYNKYVTEEYDVEIAFLEGAATNLISYSSNPKSHKIAWVHTNIFHYHWTKKEYLFKRLEKRAYERFDDIIFVSNDAEKGFYKLFNMICNTSVIYNSLDLNNINIKSNENIDLVGEYLITVGRLIPEKGFKDLIEAFSLLIEDGIYDGKLLIIGDGWMRDDLQRYIIKLGLKEKVILHGFDSNPYKYIKNSKFFICSSVVEGYSLVVAEALCLGKTILSTNCYGPMEILENGKLGYIIDQGAVSLYEGMKTLLKNPSLIKTFENKISFETINRFSLENQLYELEQLLNRKNN